MIATDQKKCDEVAFLK